MNVITTTFLSRPLNDCPEAGKYLGSSPQREPIVASMALPVAMPVRRIPYRLPKPSQWGPYSLGRLIAVPKAAVNRPAERLSGPIVLLVNQSRRCRRVIG